MDITVGQVLYVHSYNVIWPEQKMPENPTDLLTEMVVAKANKSSFYLENKKGHIFRFNSKSFMHKGVGANYKRAYLEKEEFIKQAKAAQERYRLLDKIPNQLARLTTEELQELEQLIDSRKK